jgi:hypothetical protein
MKLVDFCRDSDVAVAINKANNGTYDVSFQGQDAAEGLNIYEAWLMVRNAQLNDLKVPTKFIHEFAHLAIQHAHNNAPNWVMDVEKLKTAVSKYENKYNKVEVSNAE